MHNFLIYLSNLITVKRKSIGSFIVPFCRVHQACVRAICSVGQCSRGNPHSQRSTLHALTVIVLLQYCIGEINGLGRVPAVGWWRQSEKCFTIGLCLSVKFLLPWQLGELPKYSGAVLGSDKMSQLNLATA